ncbi:hypothetical protein GW17_00041325 [Ensete ventricosum]|nr:hypothetical protein GW17_00041325 [Ensete ventricosum]
MLNFYGSKRTLILQGGGLHICYASPLFSLSLCSYASSCLATFPVGVKLSFTAEDKLVRTRYQATECTMVIDDLAISRPKEATQGRPLGKQLHRTHLFIAKRRERGVEGLRHGEASSSSSSAAKVDGRGGHPCTSQPLISLLSLLPFALLPAQG